MTGKLHQRQSPSGLRRMQMMANRQVMIRMQLITSKTKANAKVEMINHQRGSPRAIPRTSPRASPRTSQTPGNKVRRTGTAVRGIMVGSRMNGEVMVDMETNGEV